MILLAQTTTTPATPWLVPLIAATIGGVSGLLYWSLSRNVVATDQSIAKLDKALADAFDRVRRLESTVAVQENEIRHLRAEIDMAHKLDAMTRQIDALPERLRTTG